MKQMEAVKAHRFRAGIMAPGDKFQATDHEARTLAALGWAVPVGSPAESLQDKSMTPEPSEAPKRRRGRPVGTGGKYKRRDMQAAK